MIIDVKFQYVPRYDTLKFDSNASSFKTSIYESNAESDYDYI